MSVINFRFYLSRLETIIYFLGSGWNWATSRSGGELNHITKEVGEHLWNAQKCSDETRGNIAALLFERVDMSPQCWICRFGIYMTYHIYDIRFIQACVFLFSLFVIFMDTVSNNIRGFWVCFFCSDIILLVSLDPSVSSGISSPPSLIP